MIKRILVLLVALSLILSFSSCNNNGKDDEADASPSPDGLDVIDDGTMNLEADVLLRRINPELDKMDENYPYIEVWSDLIYDKFGIDVKVSFFPKYKVLKDSLDQIYIYDYIIQDPQEGMLLHDLTDMDISYNIMKSLREEGAILSLTDNIQNSSYYDLFDKDLLAMLTDDNGDIWGVPVDTAHPVYEVRGYKEDWLRAVELDAPATVDEFYEVMHAFTYRDPDGNGMDDTYGYYGPYNFKFSLNDLLKAYGMYNGSTSFIAYNPNTGTIEDSLLSPDAPTALNMVYEIYRNKLVRKTGLSPGIYESIIPDNCGSIFWNYAAEEDVVYPAIPLTATNTENLIYRTTYGRVYFMMSGTENPDGMFDSFVQLVYGEEEAYLMLKYGIPERHYELDDEAKAKIIYDRAITNENVNKVTIGSAVNVEGDLLLDMMGRLGIYPSDDYTTYYNEIPKDSDYRDAANEEMRAQEIYYNALTSMGNLLYRVPRREALVQSDFVDNWTRKLEDDYKYYRDVEQAAIGERVLSVSEALDAYKENMKKLGLQELIDEANTILGKVTLYVY